MSNEKNMEISIPTDNDGYVMLKCPTCGERFMLKPADIEEESTIDIWCPNCGLKHNSYIDDDVYELANKMVQNYVTDMLDDFTKDIEKMFKKNRNIKVKPAKKSKKETELPICRKIGDFEVKNFCCCDKQAKIKSITCFEGGYCPFCGEMVDGNK